MNNRHFLFLLGILISFTASAQVQLGTFVGVSNYYGDLNDRVFNRPKPAVGLTLSYDVSERFSIRSGFIYSRLEGADKYSGSEYLLSNRNLEFQSKITEVSVVGELNLFNMNTINWSPYVFGGVAIFHFNPYATSNSGERVYLQPLGTEGEGLPGYSQANLYKLTDLSLPAGVGIKFRLSERVKVGMELGYRKTFTDYIDDVSGTYADANDLLEGRGQQAVDYAFRAGQSPVSRTEYPAKGAQRGNPGKMDSYYFTGVHFTYSLFNGNGKNADRRRSSYSDLKCPPVPR